MFISAIRTPLIVADSDLFSIFTQSPALLDTPLADGDVVCVVSKVVALTQNRVVALDQVEPGPAAVAAANRHISPALAQLIFDEADQVFPVAGPYWLTIKDHIFIPNAGIDLSNTAPGTAILWPQNGWQWTAEFRLRLMAHYGLARLGVVLVDSHVIPLRRGVTGIALAFAGFEGVQKEVGSPDLHGRPLEVTYKSVADDLAAAAVLLMGEADEQTPFARVQNAPVIFTDRPIDPAEVSIERERDLFSVLQPITGSAVPSSPEPR